MVQETIPWLLNYSFFWHHMLWQGCESCEKETSGEVSLDVPDRICNRTDGLIFTSYSCGGVQAMMGILSFD